MKKTTVKNKICLSVLPYKTVNKGVIKVETQLNINSVGAKLLSPNKRYSLSLSGDTIVLAEALDRGTKISFIKGSWPTLHIRSANISKYILKKSNGRPARIYGFYDDGKLLFPENTWEML